VLLHRGIRNCASLAYAPPIVDGSPGNDLEIEASDPDRQDYDERVDPRFGFESSS